MKTKTLMIGLLLIALIAAPLAIAQPDEGGQRGPRGGGFGGPGGPQGRMQRPGGPGDGNMFGMLLGRLGDKLELDEDQKAEIKTIVEANKEKIKASQEAIREAMEALNEAAESGDKNAIIAAGKSVGDAFTEQALQRANVAKQINDVLTDDQAAELEELKAEMKERRQQRRQEGREGGRRGGQRGQKGRRGERPEPPIDNDD